MSIVLKVFRLLIDNKLDLFKKGPNRKRAIKAIIKLLITISGTTLVLIYFMKKITILGVRMDDSMLSLVLLVTHLIAFFMSLGTIVSNLYMSKDNELLMHLPATHNQIFFAKLLVIYVSDFIANLLYFLPIFLTYGILANMGLVYYVLLPLFLLTLPVLAMAVAALVSVPVMLVIKFIKKNLILQTSIILLISGIVIYYYVGFVSSLVDVINIAERQVETVTSINSWIASFAGNNVIYVAIARAMSGGSVIVTFPLLLLSSVGMMLLAMTLVRPFYLKIAMSQSETTSKDKVIKRKNKKEGVLVSLIKKEARMVFRSPGYLFQYFIFTLLMPFIVYVYDKLLIAMTISMAGQMMVVGSHILVLAILAMLSTTISASAISREGGTYYIMKTTPVDFRKQVLAKVAFNVIIVFIAIVLTSVVSLIFIDINPLHIILSSIVVFIAALGQVCLGTDLDIRKPTLDWYDSGEINDVSKNTANSMIIGMIISFLLAFIMFMFSSNPFIWVLVTILAGVYALSRMYLLHLRINYYFENNEI